MLVPRLVHVILMARFPLLVLLFVHAVLGVSFRKRVSDGDFFNVTEGGGSWLDSGSGTLGEPLNVRCSSVTVLIMMSDRCQLGRHLRPQL